MTDAQKQISMLSDLCACYHAAPAFCKPILTATNACASFSLPLSRPPHTLVWSRLPLPWLRPTPRRKPPSALLSLCRPRHAHYLPSSPPVFACPPMHAHHDLCGPRAYHATQPPLSQQPPASSRVLPVMVWYARPPRLLVELMITGQKGNKWPQRQPPTCLCSYRCCWLGVPWAPQHSTDSCGCGQTIRSPYSAADPICCVLFCTAACAHQRRMRWRQVLAWFTATVRRGWLMVTSVAPSCAGVIAAARFEEHVQRPCP